MKLCQQHPRLAVVIDHTVEPDAANQVAERHITIRLKNEATVRDVGLGVVGVVVSEWGAVIRHPRFLLNRYRLIVRRRRQRIAYSHSNRHLFLRDRLNIAQGV